MLPTVPVALFALLAQSALLAAAHWHPERERWGYLQRVAMGNSILTGCYLVFALLTLPMSVADLLAMLAFQGAGGIVTHLLYRDDVRLAMRRIRRARRGREAVRGSTQS